MIPSQLYSKEVQAEQEPTRKHFEAESLTHHDYKKELVQAGPAAPTKVRAHPPHMHSWALAGCGKAADPEVEQGSFSPSYSVSLPYSLTTTVRSSLKPSGYRGHHSYRYVRVTRHWEWGRRRGKRLFCSGLAESRTCPHSGTPAGCQLHQDTGHTIPEELQLLNTSAFVPGAAFAL